MTIIVSQIVSAIGYAPFSGTLWVAEDNVLQSGKFIKAGIILNSNKWKKVTWFEIEMRWRRWAKSFISYPGRWARGDLWWGGLFQFYNGKDGDLRLLCEVWGAPSTLQKGTSFIKVWLHCPFFYFGEDDGVVFSLIFLLDPVFFTGPQTESCKSIKSSERSTGFECDNDLQKTTNGERMWHTHTCMQACTRTDTSVPSTPLYSKLAEQSPHSSCP